MMPSVGILLENWLQQMQTTISLQKCSVRSLDFLGSEETSRIFTSIAPRDCEQGNYEIVKTTTERRSVDITVRKAERSEERGLKQTSKFSIPAEIAQRSKEFSLFDLVCQNISGA